MFGCRRNRRDGRHRRRDHEDNHEPSPERTEDMIAFVERQLGITPAQREAWERFTETVRDSADALRTARGEIQGSEAGALQRFARFEVVAEAAAAALRRMRPALENLYNTLDAAQRRVLDDLISGRHMGAHGMSY